MRKSMFSLMLLVLLTMLVVSVPVMAQDAPPDTAPQALAPEELAARGIDASSYPGGIFPYYVQYGDTLARIAARFGTSVYAIASLNGIYNPNFIYVGQLLYIPGAYYPPPVTPVPPPVTPVPPPTPGQYVVRPGDTLNIIARYFGTTVYALQLANGIANPNLIYVGMVLIIPNTVPPTPPPPTTVIAYYVQYGDRLSRIAFRYGSTVSAIVAYNGISNPNVIYVGQLIYIPVY